MRQKREEIAKNPDYVKDILKTGGQKARARAMEKMQLVKEKTGLQF